MQKPQIDYVIDTKYYSLSGILQLDFVPYTPGSSYSGVTMIHLTNSNYTLLDLSSQITFVGYRLAANPAAGWLVGQYNETITMQTPSGMVVASTTYDDLGTGFATTTSSETYMVYNGTGTYANARNLVIYFNNTVVPNARTVKLMGYP